MPSSSGWSTQVMTPEEFARQMEALAPKNLTEIDEAHMEMDNLMGEVLMSLGYGEGVMVFRNAEKWYA